MTRLYFVGEKPSRLAYSRGWTWESGRLAAATLFAALEPLQVDPRDAERVRFLNLFGDTPDDVNVARKTRAATLQQASDEGWQIVALGRKVARGLREFNVPHVMIVHPAARGEIRGKLAYQRHLASIIGPLIN